MIVFVGWYEEVDCNSDRGGTARSAGCFAPNV
jgi:hypothetical protein